MRFFSFEHSAAAYQADFVLYGAAVVALAGGMAWTAIEYVLHRYVLHGLQPFRHWHEQHHRRPHALICTPTALSATFIGLLVFLPALVLGNLWQACALTLGLLSGYLAYAITHHALHHGHAEAFLGTDSAWMKRRKRWHALHHRVVPHAHYGVTSAFWDYIWRSAGPRKP